MNILLNAVPWYYRAAAVGLLALAVFGFGWFKGSEHWHTVLLDERAAALQEGARIVTVRGAVTEKIVTQYLPAIEREHVVTETIVKEVPIYVPSTDPPVSGGFRVLVDAAAAGSIPDPASIPDAAPVPAQAAASSVVGNYGSCRADQARLAGLQEWVREQGKVK